jgi:hypothetical protein
VCWKSIRQQTDRVGIHGRRFEWPDWGFYSSFISSARRLPNGNTLIDEGMNGRIFQVTNKGEIAWEYISPYFARRRWLVPASRAEQLGVPRPAGAVQLGAGRHATLRKAVIPPEPGKFRVATN